MERYRKTLKEGSRKITRAEERERNETRETEGEGSNEGERTREIVHVLTPMVFNTPKREFTNSCKVSRRQLFTGAFAKVIINTLCVFSKSTIATQKMESDIAMDLCIDEKDDERCSEAQSDVRANKRAQPIPLSPSPRPARAS